MSEENIDTRGADDVQPDSGSTSSAPSRTPFWKRINKSQWVMIGIAAATLVVGFLAYRAMRGGIASPSSDSVPAGNPQSADANNLAGLTQSDLVNALAAALRQQQDTAPPTATGGTTGRDHTAPSNTLPPNFGPAARARGILGIPAVQQITMQRAPIFTSAAHPLAAYTRAPVPAPQDGLLHLSRRQGGNLAIG